MRKLFALACLIFGSSIGFSQSYDVLFIGNSYTYSNNLPEMLKQLALSNGDTVNYDSNTPGGYTFELHSSNQNTIQKIKENKWDYVVLQEQSQRPSFPPSQVAVEVYPYAIILDSMIKASDECTETMFFMTWGRKYGDQINCQYYPPVCTYAGMQQRLRESYMEMGNMLSATVAPVGMAYKHSMAADSNVNLYMSDNSHPSVTGTYLIACVFYATIFQESPVGLSYISSLNQATADFLQNIAASTVLDSASLWNINGNSTIANYQYTINTNKVYFTNISQNADQYHWDFGDGSSDTIPDPVHTYAAPGTYVVKLMAGSDCGFDEFSDTIIITSTGINMYGESSEITIYPIPAEKYINVEFQNVSEQRISILLTDVSGKTLLNKSRRIFDNQTVIDISRFDSGCYFLTLKGKGDIYYRKLILINN
jgi:PKD repeat protein